MSETGVLPERLKGTLRGRESRNQTLTTKLTPAELSLIQNASHRDAKSTGEWLRDVALGAVHTAGEDLCSVQMTELAGIRLLLTNLLKPIATGQRLTPQVFDAILDEVRRRKSELAAELLEQVRSR